jgi:hypothetical protein
VGCCLVAFVLGATPALADTGDNLMGTEGISLGSAMSPVEVATENGFSPTSVTIDWGDGTPATNGTWVQQGELTWHLYGYHTYAEEDPYNLLTGDQPYKTTVTINGGSDVINGSASIQDAGLNGVPIEGATALTGVATSVDLAHFTDTDPGEAGDGQGIDYGAQIDWGDGTAVDNSPVFMASGDGYDVGDTHTYTAPGSYVATVTISDSFLDITQQKVNVQVSNSGAVQVTGVEGVAVSNALVAQFCNVGSTPTGASITWGDGTAADGNATVRQAGSCYQVRGTHTYAEESVTPLTTHVTLVGPGVTVAGTARVSDAPLMAKLDSTTLGSPSLGFAAGTVLAHVTDANAGAPPCDSPSDCDLSAYIDWGDGNSEPGQVSQGPSGGLEVTGPAHTYAVAGTYRLSVRVTDKGGATVTASGEYTAKGAPPETTGCTAPVPARAAVAGLYGQPLDPNYQPNWGISPDDRVLRFGNMVLCSVDGPWIYEGLSPVSKINAVGGVQLPVRDAACPPKGCHVLPVAGGVFQTTGRVTVNGLELEPNGKGSMTVDTGANSITAPVEKVFLAKETDVNYPDQLGELGVADLTSVPWILTGQSLGYIPNGGGYAGGLFLSGPVLVRIDGLATSAVETNALMPRIFSVGEYSGGQPTSPVTFPDEYPGAVGPGGAHDLGTRDRAHRAGPTAHAADDGCSYPAPTLPVQLVVPDLYLGGIEMQCVYLDYDPNTGDADGGGGFGIGPVYVNGFIKLAHGQFAGAGGGADGLDAPIFPGVTLDSIHFSALLDPTRFHAMAALSIGGGLAQLNGGALVAFPNQDNTYYYNEDYAIDGNQDDIPGISNILYNGVFTSPTIGAGGSFQPLGLPLHITGYALFSFPSYIEFGGHLHVDVLGGAVQADADLEGQFWLDSRHFNIEGGAHVCIKVIGCAGAEGLISSSGLIGCWDQSVIVGTVSVGGGYHYGDTFPSIYFHGCSDNFGDYRVSSAADVSAATGARTFNLPPGLSAVMFRIVGSGDAPAFTISGPRGAQATTGADNTLSQSGPFAVMRSQQFGMTWVGISHPAGGAWTFTPLPGSAPITGTFVSDGVPPASVHATVSGRAYRRVLHFTIRPRPGQSVQFVESGRGVTRSLGVTSAARGAIPFTPALGPAGPRQILALVTLGGLPSKRIVAGSYVAPGPPQAARPPGLRAIRRGSRLAISWGAGANTTAYQIVVLATDGRRLLFHRAAGARNLMVGGFTASGATVQVRGIGVVLNPGPEATVRLAGLGGPGRIGGLQIARSGKRVRISWRPAARALDYRISLTLTRVATPILLVSQRHTLSFRLKSSQTGVTVSVRGEGYAGALGPRSTARLAGRQPHH